MRRAAWLAGVVALAASCDGGPAIATQLAHVGPVSFEVPVGWTHTDTVRDGRVTSVWAPPDNPRKESITVIRAPRIARGGAVAVAIGGELVTAHRGLRAARISPVVPVTTRTGLHGVQLDVRFRPGGVDRMYARTHAVLVEDAHTLIHVLYTAAAPDPDRVPLELVLETLRTEDAS